MAHIFIWKELPYISKAQDNEGKTSMVNLYYVECIYRQNLSMGTKIRSVLHPSEIHKCNSCAHVQTGHLDEKMIFM